MAAQSDEIDHLIERAGRGDEPARQQLLEHLARQRARLRQMIAVRMDPRLAARVDPSGILQEKLADAIKYLADYLRDRPLPFYALAEAAGLGAARRRATPAYCRSS